jgi:hypothetical protein
MVAALEEKPVEREVIELVSSGIYASVEAPGVLSAAAAASEPVLPGGSNGGLLAEEPAAVPGLLDGSGVQPGAGVLGGTDYGVFDTLRQAGAGAGNSLQQFIEKLGAFLGNALDDATSLEVATYTSENITDVRYQDGKFQGARLRALTRVKVDGDTLVCVPEEDGEVDQALWQIHLDMLKVAQASRAELLRSVVSAATGISGLVKPQG